MGKTTGLKLLIRELLRPNPPESVVYLDTVLPPAEMCRAFEYVVGRSMRRDAETLFSSLTRSRQCVDGGAC